MKSLTLTIKAAAFALLTVLLPGNIQANPVIVRINETPGGLPVVTVIGAPSGYEFYNGPFIVDPTVEEGGFLTLIGVDSFGSIPEIAWRFTDPYAPTLERNATDIVWIQHDIFGPFGNGDLQIGFNSALPGIYYRNPDLNEDENAGPISSAWVTLYADDTLVLQYKTHKK